MPDPGSLTGAEYKKLYKIVAGMLEFKEKNSDENDRTKMIPYFVHEVDETWLRFMKKKMMDRMLQFGSVIYF